MSDATFSGLPEIAQSFPKLPDRLINRDSVVDSLVRWFDNGTEFIVLEDVEGSGKTTTAALFVQRFALGRSYAAVSHCRQACRV